MSWTSSENARQEHGEDAVHGKFRKQGKVGNTRKRWLHDAQNELGYGGVIRWRLKASVREDWALIVTEAEVLHSQ
jgi:hypothetical protein